MLTKNENSTFWKFGVSTLTLAFISAIVSVGRVMTEDPVYRTSIKLWASIIFFFISIVFINILVWCKFAGFTEVLIKKVSLFLYKKKTAALFVTLFIGALFFFLALHQGNFEPILEKTPVKLFLLILASLLAGWLLALGFNTSIWNMFSLVVLSLAALWQLLVLFPHPLDYPFSLSWSETSWYYYASFFFDRKLYGMDIPWPFLDIGRPLLLSPAFLLPGPSLVVMRLWQFFLWIGTASLAAWSLWRRLKIEGGLPSTLFILWGILWALLGPIYIHLSLVVTIVLLGFDSNNLFKSLFWIGFASIWAGVFRINWIPVPAMLGLTLYFLENPVRDDETTFQYLRRPFWIGLVGVTVGVGSFLGYLIISGRADTRIGSKFSADFLWYRLWPNATMPTGIIPGILLVSAGLLIIIYLSWRSLRVSSLRYSLLLVMLLILFAGGSFASTKIGGGNNLHNLDAYLAMLMIWGSYAITGNIRSGKTDSRYIPPQWLIVIVFLSTACWQFTSSPALTPHNVELADQELGQLDALVHQVSQSGQKVLFIQNRHLLTFGLLKDIPLVTEYELEELTEVSISNDQAGADEFRDALREKRYGLIVMGIESGAIQDLSRPFAAENNAWKQTVLFRVRSQYESVLVLPESGIEVYAPKP